MSPITNIEVKGMNTTEPLRREVWNRFVREGVLDSSRIRERISESWHFCQRKGVNPYGGKGEHILTDENLETRLTNNKLLMDLSSHYLEKLYTFFGNARSMVLLTDAEGYVLKALGQKDTLQRALTINFKKGVRWTEELVGTNAIGTAIRINEPITVKGSEHFSVASHPWICSASPIHYEGKLVGVLDVTSPVEHSAHEHALAAVASTAFAIEKEWQLRIKEEELELLRYVSDAEEEPFLLVNQKNKVIWSSSKERIQKGIFLEELHQSSIKQTIQVRSIYNDRIIGTKIILESEYKRNETNLQSSAFVFNGVKGISSSFKNVIDQATKVAKTNTTVHIHGETGTGKELLAHAIHLNSNRAHGPFVAVNCGAIPTSLIESELFGYTSGSFTGANRKGFRGKLAQADGGTLFLDEIGEVSHSMQVALLRVLQEKEITPIGGDKPIPIDIRVITATHCRLEEMVENRAFREDLYYRIVVFPLYLPSLRERREDIPYLVEEYCSRMKWKTHFSHANMKELQRQEWKGNIRELHNVLERLQILYPDQLPTTYIQSCMTTGPESIQKEESYMQQLEKQKIVEALEKNDGNVSSTAKALNMPRSTLYRKLKKYKLS